MATVNRRSPPCALVSYPLLTNLPIAQALTRSRAHAMARPQQISNDEILAATRACVLEHGPGISLDRIAQQLGVTPPALIKRFGNRRALMVAALRPPADPPWIGHLESGPDDSPLDQQLEVMLGRILEFFLEVVPCLSTLRESGIPLEEIYPSNSPPPPVRGIRALTAWLKRARARGLVVGDDFETAATAIIGALHGRIFVAHLMKRSWSRRSQRDFLRDVVQSLQKGGRPDIVLRGLDHDLDAVQARDLVAVVERGLGVRVIARELSLQVSVEFELKRKRRRPCGQRDEQRQDKCARPKKNAFEYVQQCVPQREPTR